MNLNKKKYVIITHIKLFLEKLIVFSTLIKSERFEVRIDESLRVSRVPLYYF